MPSTESHYVVVERHGAAYRSRCGCGWSGHSWSELRPAEADAWHHTYGDDRLVDAATAESQRVAESAALEAARPVDDIVSAARSLARSATPHRPAVIADLTRAAGSSNAALADAGREIERLLRAHARSSWSTADEQWLELRTARRLIEAAQAHLEMAADTEP